MRHFRLTVGLIATMGMFAASASPAFAEFESKQGFKPATTFKSFGAKEELLKQVFHLKLAYISPETSEPTSEEFSFTCENAKGTGVAPVTPSATLTVAVTFQKCHTGSKLEKGTSVHILAKTTEFEYNINGGVKILQPIEVKETATKCLVTIGAQDMTPSEKGFTAASYVSAPYPVPVSKKWEEAFPSGFRDKLLIENHLTVHNIAEEKEPAENVGLEYEVAPLKEGKGICATIPSAEKESLLGTYKGNLHLELPNGELKA